RREKFRRLTGARANKSWRRQGRDGSVRWPDRENIADRGFNHHPALELKLPAPPGGSQTTASIPWLRSPLASGVGARNKTPAHCRLRAGESPPLSLPWWCPTSPTFAGERAKSHPIMRISDSFGPSTVG